MNILELKPEEHCAKWTNCPALFVHGIDDDFITMDHTERNFAAYGDANKQQALCEGDHNSERPADVIG